MAYRAPTVLMWHVAHSKAQLYTWNYVLMHVYIVCMYVCMCVYASTKPCCHQQHARLMLDGAKIFQAFKKQIFAVVVVMLAFVFAINAIVVAVVAFVDAPLISAFIQIAFLRKSLLPSQQATRVKARAGNTSSQPHQPLQPLRRLLTRSKAEQPTTIAAHTHPLGGGFLLEFFFLHAVFWCWTVATFIFCNSFLCILYYFFSLFVRQISFEVPFRTLINAFKYGDKCWRLFGSRKHG